MNAITSVGYRRGNLRTCLSELSRHAVGGWELRDARSGLWLAIASTVVGRLLGGIASILPGIVTCRRLIVKFWRPVAGGGIPPRNGHSKVQVRRLVKEGKIRPGLTLHGMRHTLGKVLGETWGNAKGIARAIGDRSEDMGRHYADEANLTTGLDEAMRHAEERLKIK